MEESDSSIEEQKTALHFTCNICNFLLGWIFIILVG